MTGHLGDVQPSAPFRNPALTTAERVEDLLGRMTIAEKAGLMFHTITTVSPSSEEEGLVDAATAELVSGKLISHLNVHQLPTAKAAARWHNELQELAATTRLGIPVTVSTDPRHAFAENAAASFAAGFFSAWPEAIGLAALGDDDAVRQFADAARQEYVAVGIRAALHPTVDLATEPRWARQYGTFGQDSQLAGRLAAAYLDGFQGSAGQPGEVGPQSVACMTKHFPGGGPQLDGEDPHFPYGREQVYPGNNFEEHLAPFREAIAAGTSAVMPYYGMPVGLSRNGERIEEVGFGYNRQIITGLLREELGYDGVVCTDWGLITAAERFGKSLPARAWGVEGLSVEERMIKVLEAGCDQFGGEECAEVLVRLVADGKIPERRIDESVRRLLRVKFELGLFDRRLVDEEAAEAVTGNPAFRAAGQKVQSRSVVVLKAPERGIRHITPSARIYAENVDPAVAGRHAELVTDPKEADVAVIRLAAPFDMRDELFLESMFHAGSLEFSTETIAHVRELSALVPVVLVVNLDRPAILTPLEPLCQGLLATFGVSDEALFQVLTGAVAPEGKLPFDLPRSMAAVFASFPDLPGDTEDPLFRCGHGLCL
jgi:beta-glucosidase